MKEKGKVRKGFYIEEDLLEQIDGLLEQADVKSRNEFLNQALKFYIGYLTSENRVDVSKCQRRICGGVRTIHK